MALTTQDGLIAARAGARQGFNYARTSTANQIAGGLCSLYRAAGSIPTQPAIPAAAALCTKALTFNYNDPTGGLLTYLDFHNGVATVAGTVMLFDRIFHIGGFSGVLATAQTVNSQTVLTLPIARASAAEVEWFIEFYADTGATAVTANVAVTYTDTTTSVIAVAMAATMRAGRLLPIPPVTGKTIASIQSVTLSATTGTAGNFGVTCGDRISGATLYLPAANMGYAVEALLNKIADDSCLWHVVLCSTTLTGDVRGEFTLIQG